MIGRLALVGAMAAALAAASPASAAHWTRYRVADPAATLRRIDHLRASIGEGPVTEVREWSNGCARRIAYTERRRNDFGHDEVPGRPGYTAAGAAAGGSSVLFWPPREPFAAGARLGAWAQAPYHQLQVLDPRLTRTGFSLGCMATLRGLATHPDLEPSGVPRLFAWPGDGATGVPRAIDACAERPSDPFRDVGWSCGGVGTALYVYALDAGTGDCLDSIGAPAVTVSARGRSVPVAILPGTACGWIAITGRALPRLAHVELDIAFAGTTLTHMFTTGR